MAQLGNIIKSRLGAIIKGPVKSSVREWSANCKKWPLVSIEIASSGVAAVLSSTNLEEGGSCATVNYFFDQITEQTQILYQFNVVSDNELACER